MLLFWCRLLHAKILPFYRNSGKIWTRFYCNTYEWFFCVACQTEQHATAINDMEAIVITEIITHDKKVNNYEYSFGIQYMAANYIYLTTCKIIYFLKIKHIHLCTAIVPNFTAIIFVLFNWPDEATYNSSPSGKLESDAINDVETTVKTEIITRDKK